MKCINVNCGGQEYRKWEGHADMLICPKCHTRTPNVDGKIKIGPGRPVKWEENKE